MAMLKMAIAFFNLSAHPYLMALMLIIALEKKKHSPLN